MTDTPKPKRKRGTKSQFDKAFAPVALEIGQFARAWNGLHEQLGLLFAYLFEPAGIGMPLACWHAVPDDGLKRRMLRAAVGAWRVRDGIDPKIKEEITWLLRQVDALAENRNDALHAPLQSTMDCSTFVFSVEPNYFFGNPRAKKLIGKDLIPEFSKYRVETEGLRRFTMDLEMHMSGLVAFPDRPSQPNPDPRHIRKTQARLQRQTRTK